MLQDLRYAVRVFLRNPGFALVAVLTLAMGIGVNTTLFGIINPLLFRPLQVEDQDRLVWLSSFSRKPDGPRGNMTLPDLLEYAARRDVLIDAAAFGEAQVALRAGDHAVRLTGQIVTANYFNLLGIHPAIGRAFLPAEGEPGAHPVAVISHALWRRELASSPDVVGRTIALNGLPFVIVGVAPAGFAGVDLFGPADVWIPTSMATRAIPDLRDPMSRESWWLRGIGRLAEGVSMATAQRALTVTSNGIARAFPGSHSDVSIRVHAFHGAEPEDRANVMQVSALLVGVTLMVLLVACANVAGLLLSRAAARQREIGIRLAVGASRWTLARQLFAESLLLAAAAGAVSLLLSMWTTDLLVRVADLPGHIDTGMDWRVVFFTGGMSLFAAVVFGLTPALRAAGQDLLPSLRSEPGSDARPRGSFLQRAIVAGQLALCLILLVAAGLFLRALSTASHMNVGFDYVDRVSVSMDLRMQRYAPERAAAFYQELMSRVRSLPGVRSATLTNNVPMGGRVTVGQLEFAGMPQDRAARPPRAAVSRVWTGYFSTLAIPVIRGRDFSAADQRPHPQVAIVNATMAERYWPAQDPIGQRFSFGGADGMLTIIGIVRDTLVDEFNEQPWPSVYVPYGSEPGAFSLIAWSGMGPADTIRALEQVVHDLDADLPLFRSMPLSGYIADRMDAERALSRVLGACGGLALILASLGLYGVMAFTVTRRHREIGVRVALGATGPDILRLFVGEGIRLAAIGVGIGLPPAVAVSRLLASQLVGVTTFDAVTFATTATLLAVVSVVAAWLPARHAVRVDPMAALRTE